MCVEEVNPKVRLIAALCAGERKIKTVTRQNSIER